MQRLHKGALLVTTILLSLASAGPASAGASRTVESSDDRPGGSNSWIDVGDQFRVCDMQA